MSAMLLAVCMGERVGYGDTNDDEWSYLWYPDEPFQLYCNSSKLSVRNTEYIVWQTPGEKILQPDHDDNLFKTNEYFGVPGYELHIKKLTSETSGVYICRVHENGTNVLRTQTILGINIRDHKYDELFDKYRHHVIVAVIATVVFVVPFATVCIVFQFRYRTPEQRARAQEKKHRSYAYNGHQQEMQKYRPDGLAEVQSVEGKGAYENPEFVVSEMPDMNTQMWKHYVGSRNVLIF